MNVNARGVFTWHARRDPENAGSRWRLNRQHFIDLGLTGQKFNHMGYNAAKGAVRLATKAACVQFARDNIRVKSVHPASCRRCGRR